MIESKINSESFEKNIEEEIKESVNVDLTTFLHNKNIAISISDSEDIDELGFSKTHQQDIVLEITRYLIINGATLLYGGDLRAQGYTFLFSEIVEQYIHKKQNKFYYKNYFSFPIYIEMLQKQKLDFKKNGIEIVTIAPPKHLNIDSNKFYPPNTSENLYIWSEALTEMRNAMNNDTNARVFMGGAKTNFKGKYPGLMQEALLSLESDIPTYFIGAFGGITKSIINAILNQEANELTEKWQRDSNQLYADFIDFYNQKNDVEKIDYATAVTYLNNFSLEKLCKNNGLNKEENIRLFETIHFPEIIYLVLKGLKTKFNK